MLMGEVRDPRGALSISRDSLTTLSQPWLPRLGASREGSWTPNIWTLAHEDKLYTYQSSYEVSGQK